VETQWRSNASSQLAQCRRSLELSGLFLSPANVQAYRLGAVDKTGAETKCPGRAWFRTLGTNGKLAAKTFCLSLASYLSEDAEQHEAREHQHSHTRESNLSVEHCESPL
jgi:hypothetical protein